MKMGLDYREVFHFFGNAMLFQYLIHQIQVRLVFVLHGQVTLSVFGDIAFNKRNSHWIQLGAGNIIVVNGDREHFLKAFFGIHAGSTRRATVLFDQGIFRNGRHRPVITGQGSPGLQQTRQG